MKKPPSKVAHNRPPTFFFNTSPAAQTAKKQKSRTPESPLMQDWVFRLGAPLKCLESNQDFKEIKPSQRRLLNISEQ